jgi:hypothetical protein
MSGEKINGSYLKRSGHGLIRKISWDSSGVTEGNHGNHQSR